MIYVQKKNKLFVGLSTRWSKNMVHNNKDRGCRILNDNRGLPCLSAHSEYTTVLVLTLSFLVHRLFIPLHKDRHVSLGSKAKPRQVTES